MTLPWPEHSVIVLASMSPVKLRAVMEWLTTHALTNPLSAIKPAATNCPQPVGMESAAQCARMRFGTMAGGAGIVLLSIENFIQMSPDGSQWQDAALIIANFVNAAGEHCTTTVVSDFVAVPAPYAPTGPCDLAEPRGYKQTVGDRISASVKGASSTDWFKAVDSTNPTRAGQICGALDKLFIEPEERAIKE
jgi:hypothetical protein